MDELSLQDIKKYLQREDVQRRIQRNIHHGRSEVTVTIGRAADLFHFSENQLRDWEERGLLTPQRTTKQRQYSLAELDKLAIIRELIDAGYTVGEILSQVGSIRSLVFFPDRQQDKTEELDHESKFRNAEVGHTPIDQRLERANKEVFWRYYASHVLRLSLMLICDDISVTRAGLILPLYKKDGVDLVRHSGDLPKVGESLVGWLGQTRSFYTFLSLAPSFKYPSDFRIYPLQPMEEDQLKEDMLENRTLIVMPREEAKPLTLPVPVVETIRRLLAPLYNDVQDWRSYLGQGMRSLLNPAIDFNNSRNLPDIILNGLADMVVRLGGQGVNGQDRWHFCCILLPEDQMNPLQQRTLVVRAQSEHSPHKVGRTSVSPGNFVNSLSLRAFQSGHVIYRREVSDADTTIALRELEGPISSAVAVQVGGETGQPLAVLYVVSNEVNAFSKADQRILRIMGRIVEELLLTYYAHQHVTERLGELVMRPTIVDTLFGDFLSENDFIEDIEVLLANMKAQMDEREEHLRLGSKSSAQHATQSKLEEIISFIGIDVDNQSAIANKYGDRMTRTLSRTIGLRINEMMQALMTKHTDCKLYHIYADRFYLLLKGIPLEQARAKAEAMRQALEGHISIEQPISPDNTFVLSDVTIRLGVTSYTYAKLEENLMSDHPVNIVAEVRAKIARALDVALKMGMDEGGNVVIAWNNETRGFVRWSPKKVE